MGVLDRLGPVGVLGTAGLLAAAVLLWAAGRGRAAGGGRWIELQRGEEGAAYALSYVMTMPIYLLLVCLIIEAALTMTVKLGTTYAAFAAARSYAVWLPLSGQADAKARQAAAQAMTPFAADAGSGGGGSLGSAYSQYAGSEAHHVAPAYLERKRASAGQATAVSLDSVPSSWDGDVTVTVRYEMPFHIPAIGRLLGYGRSLTVESRATLQVEGVKGRSIGEANPLGIQYEPGEL